MNHKRSVGVYEYRRGERSVTFEKNQPDVWRCAIVGLQRSYAPQAQRPVASRMRRKRIGGRSTIIRQRIVPQREFRSNHYARAQMQRDDQQ